MTTCAPTEESILNRLEDKKLFRTFAYVDGNWISGSDGRVIKVNDPASSSQLGDVAALSGEQSLQAVAAARRAAVDWAGMLPQDRSASLYRWFRLMREAREDLAVLMTLEQGKPLSESRGEIDYAASFIEFYSEEAKRPNIEGVTSHLQGAEVEVWREPSGVAGLVTPWNFPSAMLTRKAGAALAAGCTVVAHPSAETPYSALALAELADRAGLPKGVFNVVTGHAPEVVGPWQESSEVRVLSFTGSTEVGRLLYRQSAATLKRLVMELGGHAPFLVFADADLDWAVEQAIGAKFATSGQDCLAANRFFIERPVYEPFCRKFTERTAALTVGPGLEDPDIGPLMNESALEKQVEHVRDAVAKGARVLTGGERHPAGTLFFTPTVLCDV
ncbi:MAG TPA: aldehyde dehydrogenase family protein, partial [Gammaproteobacteria bacterium]|nr:aldehyde dehydrogenase family protein [Gammaproteobacteria bacterium]